VLEIIWTFFNAYNVILKFLYWRKKEVFNTYNVEYVTLYEQNREDIDWIVYINWYQRIGKTMV